MKKFHGITIGGLQSKIFNLMLIFIIALIGAYVTSSLILQKKLTTIVEDTNQKQEASIAEISEATMDAVLTSSMTKTTALQAYIADDLFAGLRYDVLTLKTYAEELVANKDQYGNHAYYAPDAEKDGTPTVQLLHEEGVDPADSEYLGLFANMSEVLLAMFSNSENVSGCFIATTDGCLLAANDRSASCVEDGVPVPFAVRQRPWYIQAVETGRLFFTGVELDLRTEEYCLECITPVYDKNGTLVAVIGADIFLSAIRDYVNTTSNDTGFVCVVSGDGKVLFSPKTEGTFKAGLSTEAADLRTSDNKELADFVTLALTQNTGLQSVSVDGKEYYVVGSPMETTGWTVISVVDKAAAYQPTAMMLDNYGEINEEALEEYRKGAGRTTNVILILSAMLIVLALTAAVLVASRVVKPLEHMTKRINALTGEDAVFEMEKIYCTKDEVQILAESFAGLSAKTRNYIAKITEITAEKERIGAELSLATRIQADMLPNIYPAFPDRKEFDIYATMNPAREVGGDFYDFFLIDKDHLCMMIADVSGKGVPAALFMMASRIILASNAKQGKSPAEILTFANESICQNNREEMFVTVWLGILEISTGKLTAANAGHEYPVLKHPDGTFEIFKDKHGLVIGGMDGVKYQEYEIQLRPGSKLFLYTDGVPEATDAEGKQFGMDRMVDALNIQPDGDPTEMLANVRRAVDEFVKDAEQFDDLTMLGLEYKGDKQ